MANFPAVGTARGRRVKVALGCMAIAVVALTDAPAPAKESRPPTQISSLAYEFVPPDITIEAGGEVVYTNIDVAPHNVMAKATHRDGSPLFGSDTIDAGKWVPVKGVSSLAPGVYDFTCTLHPRMLGTLTVEAPS